MLSSYNLYLFWCFVQNIKGEGRTGSGMDFSSIRTVQSLCSALGIPTCDLLLPCILCDCYLHLPDLQNFDAAPFTLVWRQGGAYGICTDCSRVSATFERTNFYQGSYSADGYLAVFGEAVFCVPVRCLYCLHRLTIQEIDCMVQSQQIFYLVRGILRGVCEGCNN
ncbi:putative E6 oncogenic protein [Eptesicus serotinus papillomavirus 2]|uniref:Protein E6 n=1 Tax=Eptesicus serotinus papillomavirus 2 TaxID=1464072 RepID=W8EC56_9PAPI|nr:putative E6 oncogenic protein [Eptesicus serotinus papillomavirus 2]AHJ81390.1 putative E6 oncogenic protein [Eptesicus serotinus papillomavirus 2]